MAKAGRAWRWAVPVLVGVGVGLSFEALAVMPSVPVRIGGDVDRPACAERGVLGGPEVRQGRVEVRSGPTGSFGVIARLDEGTAVFVCDENGTHIGIIFGDGPCGIEETMQRRTAYRGTCSSGWVHNRAVGPVDGESPEGS